MTIERSELTHTDLEDLRNTRNDYRVRRWMKTDQIISSEEHLRWFKSSKYLHLFSVWRKSLCGEIVGYSYLNPSNLLACNNCYDIGLFKIPGEEPGTGAEILQHTECFAAKTLGRCTLLAQVKVTNMKSIKLFVNAEFSETLSVDRHYRLFKKDLFIDSSV